MQFYIDIITEVTQNIWKELAILRSIILLAVLYF